MAREVAAESGTLRLNGSPGPNRSHRGPLVRKQDIGYRPLLPDQWKVLSPPAFGPAFGMDDRVIRRIFPGTERRF